MDNRKKCPYCGEYIAVTAKKCRFCGEWFSNTPQSQPQHQPQHQPQQPPQPQLQAAPAPSVSEQVNHGIPVGQTDEKSKSFFEAYFLDSFIRRYTDFSGYCPVKEFWLTYLAVCIISLGAVGLSLVLWGTAGYPGMLSGVILLSIISLGLVLPGLAISCRRLKDAGFSPWMILISLVPILGSIAILIMYCRHSKYEHEESDTHFNVTDTIVTGGCIVMFCVGAYLSINPLTASGPTGYDLGDYEDINTTYDPADHTNPDNTTIGSSYVGDYPSTSTSIPTGGSIMQFEYLSTSRLTDRDLAEYNDEELRILRNAIYAMHNYRFDSQDLRDYFRGFYDYEPRTKNISLSDIEMYNVNIIKSHED